MAFKILHLIKIERNVDARHFYSIQFVMRYIVIIFMITSGSPPLASDVIFGADAAGRRRRQRAWQSRDNTATYRYDTLYHGRRLACKPRSFRHQLAIFKRENAHRAGVFASSLFRRREMRRHYTIIFSAMAIISHKAIALAALMLSIVKIIKRRIT